MYVGACITNDSPSSLIVMLTSFIGPTCSSGRFSGGSMTNLKSSSSSGLLSSTIGILVHESFSPVLKVTG